MSTVVSLLTEGTNTHKETVEKFNMLGTYLLDDGILPESGTIADASPDTGPFAMQAQGTPDMTVKAKSTGTPYAAALIIGTPTDGVSQKVIVQCTADENVTIAANSSGSTKYDWIYIDLDADVMKDPAADSSDVSDFVTSRSTSSSSDDGTPPTYGLVLAVVTVANGASSISNANIADKRVYAGFAGKAIAADAWISFTPSFTNITVGDGTLAAKYEKTGRTVRFTVTFTLGSSSSVGTSPTFTLPVTSATYQVSAPITRATYVDGSTYYAGVAWWATTTTVALVVKVVLSAPANVSHAGITATVPMTWATGDKILVEGTYESAS